MNIFELLCDLLDSFTFLNTTGWITEDPPKEFLKNLKSGTASDVLDYAKTHEKIEKEYCKKNTHLLPPPLFFC